MTEVYQISPQGVAADIFQTRGHEKLETYNFSFCYKCLKYTIFGQRESILTIKSDFGIIKGKVLPRNMLISDERSYKIEKNVVDHFSISLPVLKIFSFKVFFLLKMA